MFKMVVGVVVRNRLMVIAEEVSIPEGFNHAMHKMAALFYADDGLVVLNQLKWIQWVLFFLSGLFERLELNKSMKKMASMV